MNDISISELPDDELAKLLYQVSEEVEARLKYRAPIELTEEEKAKLPF